MTRVMDGRFQHVAHAHGAIVTQQDHVGIKRARDTASEQAGARNEIKTQRFEMCDRGGCRCGPLTADHFSLSALHIVNNDRNVTAGSVEMGFDDLQREGGCGSCIKRVAATFKNAHRNGRGDPMGGRDSAECSVNFRARREAVWRNETH